MKAFKLSILVFLLSTSTIFSQKAEVLYFKANLSCCQARACNNLENQVKGVVESNYTSDEVVFKSIRIANEENAELVEKFNAKSQSVIVLNSNNDYSYDASDMVKQLRTNGDVEAFEEIFIPKVNEVKNKKASSGRLRGLFR